MSRDVKVKDAYKWGGGKVGPIQTPEIREVARNFRTNLERVRWNVLILPWMVGKATLYQNAATRVEMSASVSELDHPDFQKDAQAKIHAITDEDEARCLADINLGFKRDAQALNTIDFLIGCYGQPKPDGSKSDLLTGFDALYQSVIIAAWTAVEIALDDLWAEANAVLRHLHSEDQSQASRIVDIVQQNRGESPEDRDRIRRWTKTKGFKTLLSTRVAYGCWFTEQTQDIDAALSDLGFDALALMRNVMVHSAACPDDMFLRQARGVPGLQKWTQQASSEIELHGEDLHGLIEGAIKPAGRLIMAVDRWVKLRQ